jgi:hypothetical protein
MKLILALIVILYTTAAVAQESDTVFLKWKLAPKEVISYKTVMEEIDTANSKNLSFNFGAFNKFFADTSNGIAGKLQSMFGDINKAFDKYDFITNLSETKKGIIDIEMSMKKKEDAKINSTDSAKNFAEMLRLISGDVVLRGAITETGAIQSFYTKNDQKNLIAMLFELPNKPIKVGDSWPLTINFMAMDQNFTCDTSFKKNVVTLIGLKKENGETLAIIKYDIMEFISGGFKTPIFSGTDKGPVKTVMKMSFNGIAEFAIGKGRWASFNGIMALSSSGFMSSGTTKRFALLAN